MIKKKKIKTENVAAMVFLVLASIICVVPFVMVLSASFSDEKELLKFGYSVLPRGFTTAAYKRVLVSSNLLTKSYVTSILQTSIGTICGLFLTAITAYPLSRKDYKWRKGLSFYFYFTCLFSGGAIPSYILISQYLHLNNTFAVLIVPLLMSVWNVFVMRTYFSQISPAVIESARIDGASEYRIFFSIVIPMSQVGVATIGFLIMLSFWNEWYMCYMYMTNGRYMNLQYFLYQTMSNIEAIMSFSGSASVPGAADTSSLPTESVRMAMCVLAVGPMLFAFLYFQKYFTKGIAIGSVKG